MNSQLLHILISRENLVKVLCGLHNKKAFIFQIFITLKMTFQITYTLPSDFHMQNHNDKSLEVTDTELYNFNIFCTTVSFSV